eukprot:2968238-Prorocentrum_lima.AAC.1
MKGGEEKQREREGGGEETDARTDDEAEEVGTKKRKQPVLAAHRLESVESGLETTLHIQSKMAN